MATYSQADFEAIAAAINKGSADVEKHSKLFESVALWYRLDQPAIGWNHLMAEKLIDFKRLEQLICVP